MEGYEEDDDTHFCIKCHSTVHGLENYVRHRQSGCRPTDDKCGGGRALPSTPATVSYPEILNADAFFSSLELQSSSKPNPRRAAGLLLEGSRKLKKDERRKKSQKSQPDTEESVPKEKLASMLAGVADLDDPTEHLCSIPSLVGFPDIVSSASGKPATSNVGVGQSKLSEPISHPATSIEASTFSTKHHSQAEEDAEAEAEGEVEHSLESLMSATDSKQPERKRQQEDWLEATILADLEANSENKELARYEFEYQQDEDSEEDILEEDLAEEESYSESEDGEDREGPPRGHTGGKWKPGLEHLPENMSQLQEEDVDPEEDHQEHPPPSYTGGKWRPSEPSQQAEQRLLRKMEEYEAKDSTGQPPPGHTRGKWVPGARSDIESGYWCSPCGRKLASRLVYNRHLRSDLHARRSIREIDGGLHLPRQASAAQPTTSRKTRIQKVREEVKVEVEVDAAEAGGSRKGSRRREKQVLSCEMCHARVRRPQMGKHLLSHYHCRVAGVNPRGPRARRFLLENMASVVRQCPFQCSSCRFYCNTEETFLRHWRSDLHATTLPQQVAGTYRCTPCDFWCETNDQMETHLLTNAHRDLVSMMNGSVPMVIARQQAIPCADCDMRFRYNLQLRLHMKATGHEGSWTGSDHYQRRIQCGACPLIARSLISLQRHQLASHTAKDATPSEDPAGKSDSPNPYFCSFCAMNFASARDAILHRRTSRHKEMVKARKHAGGASGDSGGSGGDAPDTSSACSSRECPYCGEKQPNLSEHKDHLRARHPEHSHSCPRCGALFALSQDVTLHTRENHCRPSSDKKLNAPKAQPTSDKGQQWKCSSCTFATDSQAEFIFHEAIHSPPLGGTEAPTSTNFAPKYACPLCKRLFGKVSLRNHIRTHTGERPFVCAKCFATYSRRSDLNSHQRDCTPCTPGTSSSTDWPEPGLIHRSRTFHCSECSNAFYTKHALRQHMLRHAGKKYKCGLPGCPTVLRTASELRTHRALLHESTASDRPFHCNECSYAAKTKTQLRRHRARHEDAASSESPLKSGLLSCRYPGCTFRTRLASHLRRHTRLHTGAKPYKCRHCSYASNNLENLRKHVLSTNLHPGRTIYECEFCKRETSQAFHTNFAKELQAHLSTVHTDSFPTPRSASDYVLAIFTPRVDEGQPSRSKT